MFDQSSSLLDPDVIGGAPLPGDEGYESLLVFEAQQEAYWSAVSRGEIALLDGLLDPTASRTDEALLDAATQAERLEAQAQGTKLQAIADYACRKIAVPEVGYDEEGMLRSVECEVAVAFRVAKAEAFDLLDLAMTLTRRLPKTFTALKDGQIGLRKVRAIADETLNLNVAQCAQLEDRVLPEAAARTVRSLREKVRREVEKLDADAVRKRREAAIADRALYVKDEPDGMATLCLYLPAEQARAIYATINSRIPAHRPNAADDRKIGARRLDDLLDVLATALGIDLSAVADTDTPGPHRRADRPPRPQRQQLRPHPADEGRGPRPGQALPLPRLPPPRRALRCRPHGRLQDRRSHGLHQPRLHLPLPSPGQADARLARQPGPGWRLHLDRSREPGLRHPTTPGRRRGTTRVLGTRGHRRGALPVLIERRTSGRTPTNSAGNFDIPALKTFTSVAPAVT